MYLPYKISNRGLHCEYAIDNGSYWGSVAEKANYFIKYTETAVAAQTLKKQFESLEANKDGILKTLL